MSKSNTIRLSVGVDATYAVRCMKAFLIGAFSVPEKEATYARVLAFLGRKDVQDAFTDQAFFQLLGQGAETHARKGLGDVPGHPATMKEVEEKSDTMFEAWDKAITAAGFTRKPIDPSKISAEELLNLLLNGR